jgi:hypothetical protein
VTLTPAAVTYLFRYTGQVLGVSLTGACPARERRCAPSDAQSLAQARSCSRFCSPSCASASPGRVRPRSAARSTYPRCITDARVQLIDRIRHETGLIAHLDAPTRAAAVATYADALRAVFACQAASAALSFLACTFIQEAPLPCVHIHRATCSIVLTLRQGYEGGRGRALSPAERGSAHGRARDGARVRGIVSQKRSPALGALGCNDHPVLELAGHHAVKK